MFFIYFVLNKKRERERQHTFRIVLKSPKYHILLLIHFFFMMKLIIKH